MELKIERLSKTYANGVHALREVSLTIPRGMFGLLGPNGAGKSTLMRILATLQEADSGSARLGEMDVLREKEAVRRGLGYLPQEFGLYPKVEAAELLDHFALLKGIGDRGERRQVVAALLHQTNLWDARHKRLGGFSGGMRQRFGIAVALIGNPRLIIVDEPTAGLDPAERVRFLNLLSEIGENAVVILSTHIVEDVSELCSRMAIINRGQILLEGEPLRTIERLRGRLWRRVVSRAELAATEAAHTVISTKLLSGRTVVHVVADERPDPSFEPVEPDLEDVYFSVIRGIPLDPPLVSSIDSGVVTPVESPETFASTSNAEQAVSACNPVFDAESSVSAPAAAENASNARPEDVAASASVDAASVEPLESHETVAKEEAAAASDAHPSSNPVGSGWIESAASLNGSAPSSALLFDHGTLPLFPDDPSLAPDPAAEGAASAEMDSNPEAGTGGFDAEPADQLGLFADAAPDAGAR
jgi:ABC-2 type transport system ATP-binding protein